MSKIESSNLTRAATPFSPSNGAQTRPDRPDDWPWLASYDPELNWHETFPDTSLPDLLDASAKATPDAICTDFLGRQQTYRDIKRCVDEVAAGLQQIGVTRGTRVGLLLPNCPAFIIYYYAILKAGGTVVNYNPLYTVEELAFQVKDSGTRYLVTLDLNLLFDKVENLLADDVLSTAIVVSFAAQLPPAKAALFRVLKAKELARPHKSEQANKIILQADLKTKVAPTPVEIDLDRDIAVIQYTGGTTGKPKGAMLTHRNVTVNALQVVAWVPDLKDKPVRVLGVLPLFHVFAMTVVMNFGIAKGARLILMPKFVLDDTLRLIHVAKPNWMPAVPTLFNALLNHPKLANYDLTSLTHCISGGAALPVEIKQRFEAHTGARVAEGYGLSEAAPVVACNPVEGLNKAGSIGLPFPQTIISLRDLDDPKREVAPGQCGEICVKGPQVMAGYWNRPEETEQVFVDGYLRTGDVARMDEAGYFFIEDRIKDLIICSGFNVYPRQIEGAFYAHDAVEEVTVIGVPHPHKGEVPKAFIKLKKGQSATADELLSFLRQKLSKHECPAEIEFRDALPKTMIGKLSKKELKAEEAARREGQT